MIRHVVLFKLKSEADRAELVRLMGQLDDLHPKLDGVPSWWLRCHQVAAGHWDASLIADYVDGQGLEAYLDHPDHAAFSAAVLRIADVAVFDAQP